MTEQNQDSNGTQKVDLAQPKPQAKDTGDQLDAAGRSLSEALQVSFAILKIIMIVLVVIFLASGFKTISPDEQALVLRFGKIRGIGQERLLGPGLHWILPYPIDEIIRINVEKKPNLPIDSFWYYQKLEELLPEAAGIKPRIKPKLDPVMDGYCLTRSEKQIDSLVAAAGSDYNIVHCKWQLTYKIDDPERFFKNVYIDDVMPGQSYADIIAEGVKPLLISLLDYSVVTAMVNYTIDEAISSQARIPKHVKRLLQRRLDAIESGIRVISVQLTDITWPRQVNRAFQASIKASQESQKLISKAESYADNTLNEAAGPVALELLAALKDESLGQQRELLWSQLAGLAQEKIASARAYRTKVVETARANAEYLQQILPEYRKRPRLVVQKLYQDAIEYVLDNVDEKIIIQPTEGTKGREIRVLLNRDPLIKSKSEQAK